MKKGFTLIELLVVVLIIGILSSVALPQYQKAVLKSRASEAWTNLKNLNMASSAYCLEGGNSAPFSSVKDSLSIEVKDSKNFKYEGDILCDTTTAASAGNVYATWQGGGNYNFKLGVNRATGRRSCEGSTCSQLGFTKSSSDRTICLCGASSCYYAD